MEDTYIRLLTLLDQQGIPYRLIDHAPEGRTELVSAMRGNTLSQAAKCIILMVKLGKKVTRYILAVVPGDARVDLPTVKALMQGTYVAFASAVAHTALEGSNARLAAAHTRLQESSARVEELSVIRERNRIAREIHDTLGHALTLLAVQLETATQLEARGDPRLREELLEARQVAKACLTDVRHSVEALRPEEASAGSLQEQLRKLVAEFETTCRETRITLDLEEATHPLHPELCLALYRCAQEALTNIRKHAHATKVLLRLSTSGGQEDQVVPSRTTSATSWASWVCATGRKRP